MVYLGRDRSVVIPLPIVGHWLKQAWGSDARLATLGRIPRLPGL
jgi:sulfide:quinone oxidoreductase